MSGYGDADTYIHDADKFTFLVYVTPSLPGYPEQRQRYLANRMYKKRKILAERQ